MMPALWLLAAEHYFFHLRNPFRNVTSQQVWQGSLVLINRHSPWRLFRELCAAHRLHPGERSLLKRLAIERKLPHPATLFVEPGLWDCHELGSQWQQQAERLGSLRERLFVRD
jgi:hypothetical protein